MKSLESELMSLLGNMCSEVVDVAQQTDFPWEALPNRLFSWMRLNLMQRQQAFMYCSSWTVTELYDFTMSLEDKEKMLKELETFLFNVMCLTRPARAVNQRRGLRQYYRQKFLEQMPGSALCKVVQQPLPEDVEVQPLKPDELPLQIKRHRLPKPVQVLLLQLVKVGVLWQQIRPHFSHQALHCQCSAH